MLDLLRTRRWIGFTALVVGAIIGFGLLSMWQWHRADERRIERVALQSSLEASPVPIDDLLPLGPDDAWRTVAAVGRYSADDQVLVRKRPLDGRNGFWVMARLDTAAGPVWVNRGWLAATGDALATPPIPAPPPGEVTVTGYVRALEPDLDATGLPAGQVASPSASALAGAEGGFVQVASSTPAERALVPVPVPTIDEGRNISYAIQWLIFATVAIAGWFVFLRREAREDRAEQSGTAQPAEAGTWTSG